MLADIVQSCGKVVGVARIPVSGSTEIHSTPGSAGYPTPGTFLGSSPAAIAFTYLIFVNRCRTFLDPGHIAID